MTQSSFLTLEREFTVEAECHQNLDGLRWWAILYLFSWIVFLFVRLEILREGQALGGFFLEVEERCDGRIMMRYLRRLDCRGNALLFGNNIYYWG